ncbi:pyridoxamine 5'-phosphate oxidase-like FMN-binding protein [Fictibacillus macauensis ZFHKF-1]|uniref:Pyridoxamine 5'-phosphate oxidase-like FMN-binding protein n=1 Tax=Fictibacillus macauensis ZFHKF-1 TaxID=1196324 RepID=I8UI43_9BACL|nr:pyridoxamine 5'-phosphate oxidase family protein [Fictibacillus macauensis]EIT86483.1 pyridoxamine 5'-phosphate oxidase-like FMN-binding protein [Fictibacillus macauensis ZFHKF-1]
MRLYDFTKYTPLNMQEILEVLDTQEISVLGTIGDSRVNLAPMYYVTSFSNECLTVYMYSKDSGTKIRNMYNNQDVGVEVQGEYKDRRGPVFKSVVVNGRAVISTDSQEIAFVEQKFIKKYGEIPGLCDFSNVAIIRIQAQKVGGRLYNQVSDCK